ncbi:MAG: hypothetical protein QOD71_423 [Thermoleophilaceae bacterium]|jgi:hypothetical protein|nr:hypothetical protein [Thermoleophilaceae bacterium]
MPLTISREQRDALYELVVNHLSAIGDVWIELQRRDQATAKRQAQEFVEDLHLMGDLGWDETIEAEQVTLTVPRDELVGTLARLHRGAVGALGAYVMGPKDEEIAAEGDLTAVAAIGELLSRVASAPCSAADAGRTEEGSR